MPFLALLLGLLLPALPGDPPALFHVEELLYHPTDQGVTLTLLPAADLHLSVAFGPTEPLAFHTPVMFAGANRLVTIPLPVDPPGSELLYRVEVAEDPIPRPVHRALGLPPAGSDFHFAVAADTHTWAMWSKGTCGGSPPPLDKLLTTLDHIRADNSLDFLVLGTDIAMNKCGSCSACEVDGLPVSGGTIDGALDAQLRWRRVLQPDLLGSLGADLPLLFVLGDHEGEQGWLTNGVLGWSRAARRMHLPQPPADYTPGPTGGNWAARAGDLLLVALDINASTTTKPVSPDGWTLGPRQWHWLRDTLARSDAPLKIVMAEHLLGGLNAPDAVQWKGRGGITATDTGLATGTFLGEQAALHELLRSYGVQVFLSFQDHVVAWGEKLGPGGQGQGVTYVIGGRASGVAPPATGFEWYQQAMDYDQDGVPEYDTDITGTKRVGYFRIGVQGGERLVFEYVGSGGLGESGPPETVLAFQVDRQGHPSSL